MYIIIKYRKGAESMNKKFIHIHECTGGGTVCERFVPVDSISCIIGKKFKDGGGSITFFYPNTIGIVCEVMELYHKEEEIEYDNRLYQLEKLLCK